MSTTLSLTCLARVLPVNFLHPMKFDHANFVTALSFFFPHVQISKSYLAVCVGNPGKAATIDVPIGRHPRDRQRMVAVPTIQPNIRSRRALSVVTTVAFDGKLSVVEVSIETGRTHQIRVHLQVSLDIVGGVVAGGGCLRRELFGGGGGCCCCYCWRRYCLCIIVSGSGVLRRFCSRNSK